jgi:hypothetical protein
MYALLYMIFLIDFMKIKENIMFFLKWIRDIKKENITTFRKIFPDTRFNAI